MYDLDRAYSKSFFSGRRSLNWRVKIVSEAIWNAYKPKTVVDLGCGNGDLLKGFKDLGCKIFGIEGTRNAASGLMIDEEEMNFLDLRKPIENIPRGHYDLALCLEVAEHIEPEYVDVFLDNLCEFSNRIVFSAAPPGQMGSWHVNCKPFGYWFAKFTHRGYRSDHGREIYLTGAWDKWKNKKGIKAYHKNVMCWEKI